MTATNWLKAIKKAEKDCQKWHEKAKKVIRRYRDERSESDSSRKYNVLWSNVQTLQPALYDRPPKPVVARRFKNDDAVGRQAAIILEKAAEYAIDSYSFDDVMESVVEDFLLPGMGVAKIHYEPTYGEAQVDENGASFEPVVYEEVTTKYFHWEDFLWGEARFWDEVPWVAFRSYFTRAKLAKRFGEDVAAKVQVALDDLNSVAGEKKHRSKVQVWEIWDKENKQVHWVCSEYDGGVLESSDPPLDLKGFWPCPKPLFATQTTCNLIPVPDYVLYQDQADELDTLTGRIDALTDALKVSGLYAGDEKDNIGRLLTAGENKLIPVESWAAWSDKGGVKGLIEWLPIETIASVLRGLYEAREQVKQDLYEITGISDLVRGQSTASETATAQRIKGQFATLRLDDRQAEVARFAKELVCLTVEVIAEQFTPQMLHVMTGEEITEEVMQLIRSDLLRGFRIEIETDSTVKVDEQADKEARVEFLSAASGFLEKALPVAQIEPELAPLLGEMMMFGIRGFRAGRELEDEFEATVQRLEGKGLQPRPQEGPDPSHQEGQAKIQLEAQKLQVQSQKDIADYQLQERKLAMEEGQAQFERERVLRQMDIDERRLALDEYRAHSEVQHKGAEVGVKVKESERVAMQDNALAEAAEREQRIEQAAQTAVQSVQAIQQQAEALGQVLEQLSMITERMNAADEFRLNVIRLVEANGSPRVKNVVSQLTGTEGLN